MGTVGEWLGNGRGMSQGVAGAAIERPQRGERRGEGGMARRQKAGGGETSPPPSYTKSKREPAMMRFCLKCLTLWAES